ncbi:MAG TPA: nuclear transport factor 2 family protein [Actinomycetes bacterium]|jgi:ketosteroid isomerase-like protein|nr:nuclear transport factor 2 family protein [Actinomycetes bacterium]
MLIDFAQQYVQALASADAEQIAPWYHPDAPSYGPLAWPRQGAPAIAADLAARAARLDRLGTELHDVFADEAGDRAALRLTRRWSQDGICRSAIETHYLRLSEGLIAEEFAGPNSFQIADLELNAWGLTPVDTSVDPYPEILTASPAGSAGKQPQTIPERFVDAFGRNDPDALLALYAEQFTLYSPIAWGVAGLDPLRLFVQQFHQGFPGLRLALLDQFASADGTRVALRFGMRYQNTGTFFGHPPTGARGTHGEFHSLRLVDGRIVEQVVTDVSYGVPKYELTVWHREYPKDTHDPAPRLDASRED